MTTGDCQIMRRTRYALCMRKLRINSKYWFKTSRKSVQFTQYMAYNCDKVHEPESLGTLWTFTVFTTQIYQYTIKLYTRGGQWDKLQEPHLGGNFGKSHI
jgi:hypothetical protein